MHHETVEVRVARLEEKMEFLVNEAKEAKQIRKVQYSRNEENNLTLVQMAASIKAVEDKLAGQSPTIEEFITIKHKVVGAGKIGKWLWIIGSGLIGFVFGARETLLSWLTKT